MSPQETPIHSRPSSRYLIDSEITLRNEWGEPWVVIPNVGSPGF
jgi:hypothetical protein